MDLEQSVQDFIQAGRSLFTAFEWLLSLTGSRAPESGVYHCVVWAVFVISMLVFIASRLPIAIPDFGCAWVAGAATDNQLSSPTQKRVIRLVRAAIVLGFSWPRCLRAIRLGYCA